MVKSSLPFSVVNWHRCVYGDSKIIQNLSYKLSLPTNHLQMIHASKKKKKWKKRTFSKLNKL